MNTSYKYLNTACRKEMAKYRVLSGSHNTCDRCQLQLRTDRDMTSLVCTGFLEWHVKKRLISDVFPGEAERVTVPVLHVPALEPGHLFLAFL
jgi:hypothetical protein